MKKQQIDMNRIFILALTLTMSTLLSTPTQANFLNFSLNDDAISGDYLGGFYRPGFWIHSGFYHHQDKGENYHAGLLLTEPHSNRDSRLWMGVGGQGVYFDADGPDGSALAIGGMASALLLPGLPLKGEFEGFYAPSVLAFNNIDHYYRFSARLVFDLMSQVSVYGGYRKIHLGFDKIQERDLDDTIHVGAIMQF